VGRGARAVKAHPLYIHTYIGVVVNARRENKDDEDRFMRNKNSFLVFVAV
jgi:hypothetical protein